MRWVSLALLLVVQLPMPVAAQQPSPTGVPNPIPLSQLLAAGFEIKGAVLAGMLVQKGTLAYICTTTQRERPIAWACFPLHR
jgi:hypothetical protein